jgi:hypothetical protein
MAVVIGSSSVMSIQFADSTVVTDGINSVDVSFGASAQRLYALGQGVGSCGIESYAELLDSKITINFSIYGGNTPEVDLCPPTEGCVNGNNIIIVNLVLAGCANIPAINTTAFIDSYSYQKDVNGFGVESWSATGWDSSLLTSYESIYILPEPDVVIIGLSQGTLESDDPDIDLGTPGAKTVAVTELEELVGAQVREYDLGRMPTKSPRGSVSTGGEVSIGEYMVSINATFKSVGNSTGYNETNPALIGKANVTINNTPVYLGNT